MMRFDRDYRFCCVSLFGLEGITADECRRLSFRDVETDTGKVFFTGTLNDMITANICLRTAERVLIYLGGGSCTDFETLYQLTHSLPWEDYIPRDGEFPVKGHALSSQLHSVPDCQKIIKKAIASRLGSAYHEDWLPESGEKYQIQFSLLRDEYKIYIDTSGEGLHKRGYRAEAGIAPLRETLAAGILLISRYRGYESLLDPMCGAGTFAIEAALIAQNRAPGIARRFAFEYWRDITPEEVNKIRQERREAVRPLPCHITANDIDPEMTALSRENARKAGVEDCIFFMNGSAGDIVSTFDVVIANPPYGERMADKSAAAQAARLLGRISSSRAYIITSDEQFEDYYGKKAIKKRKLYNGMIRCNLYMYFRDKVFPDKKSAGRKK